MASHDKIDPALTGAFEIFQRESSEFFARVEHQLASNAPSYPELRLGFHKIKGAAGFFGLDSLRIAAAQAEECTLSPGDAALEIITSSLPRLRQLFEHACAELGATHG